MDNQEKYISSFFQDWTEPAKAARMLDIRGDTIESMRASLDHLDVVRKKISMQSPRIPMLNAYLPAVPFVFSSGLFPPISLINRYYNELRELFTFNESYCYREFPDDDETVLHIRGFDVESPIIFDILGYRDLDVNQAYELLGNLNAGGKVAIISRFEEKDLKNYKGVLQKEGGLNVRFVSGQTGPEDFCFLKSARKEAVGDFYSTYFKTAVLLSDTVKNVTFYINKRWQRSHELRHAKEFTQGNWALRKNVNVVVF